MTAGSPAPATDDPDARAPPAVGDALPALRLSWLGMHAALRRHLRGWGSADLAYLRATRGRLSGFPVHLKARSDGRVYRVDETSRLRFLAATIYASERWLGKNAISEEVQCGWEIAERVEAELHSKFSAVEIDRRATGGFPDLKEAVLQVLMRRLQPDRVIETGVAQGISTTFLLEALRRNRRGRLSSVDLPQRDPAGTLEVRTGVRDRVYVPADRPIGWLVPEELRARWELAEGRAEEWLPEQDGPADVFFHDSLHTAAHMRFEYEWALAHLVDGGVLVSDDIHWNDAFPSFLADHPREFRQISGRFVGVAQRTRIPARLSGS